MLYLVQVGLEQTDSELVYYMLVAKANLNIFLRARKFAVHHLTEYSHQNVEYHLASGLLQGFQRGHTNT